MRVRFAWLAAPRLLFETEKKYVDWGWANRVPRLAGSPASLAPAGYKAQPREPAGTQKRRPRCPRSATACPPTPGCRREPRTRPRLPARVGFASRVWQSERGTSRWWQPLVPSTPLSNFKSQLKAEISAMAPGTLKGHLRGPVLWCHQLLPTYLSGNKTRGRNKSFWFGSWNKKILLLISYINLLLFHVCTEQLSSLSTNCWKY